MTIYRNGNAIELTAAELNQAWTEVHRDHLRLDIESCIDDLELSFDSFCVHGYSSAAAFRTAFVEECVPQVEEWMETGSTSENAVYEVVQDMAGEWNYDLFRKEDRNGD